MQEERIRIRKEQLESTLLPRLAGQVFHVTTRRAFRDIQRDGSIRTNQDGKLPFTFQQSQNSYFRKKGCVCLFDLRAATQEQIEEALRKFYFLDPPAGSQRRTHGYGPHPNPVFLIISKSCYGRLIPWSVPFTEVGYREMWIPHVEAGYLGEVPLTLVDTAIVVTVRRKSDVQKLREARRRGAWNLTDPIPLLLYGLVVKQATVGLTTREEQERKEWDPEIRKLFPPSR